MVSKVTHILRSHTILAQNTDIGRRKTLIMIQQTLFKWLLCISHIMYCSCRGLDHIFKVLTKKIKNKKRPVHRKSAYNIRGTSQQKVSTALLRDLRGFWNQKKVTPLKVSCSPAKSLEFYLEGYGMLCENFKDGKPLNRIWVSVQFICLWATARKNVGRKGGCWQLEVF